MAYIIHFLLECVGQGILYLAYKHVCQRPWHRAGIWFAGTAIASYVTVQIIG